MSISRLNAETLRFSAWLEGRNKTNSVKGRLIRQALYERDSDFWVQLVIDGDQVFDGEAGRKAAIRLMWEYRKHCDQDQTANPIPSEHRPIEFKPSAGAQVGDFANSTYIKVLRSLGLPL